MSRHEKKDYVIIGLLGISFIALMIVGVLLQYRINSERYPSSAPWTRWFK